jgi:hypothetical protein
MSGNIGDWPRFNPALQRTASVTLPHTHRQPRKMNQSSLQKLLSASIALLLGFLLAGTVHAAGPSNSSEDGLGKLHAARGVKCVACHASAKKPQPVAMEKCLTCHGDTRALAEKTANVKPRNPHESRHYGTEADCNLCHHQHRKSENFCLDCHNRFDFKVK